MQWAQWLPRLLFTLCRLILSVSQAVPTGLGIGLGLEAHADAYGCAAWGPQQDYGHIVLGSMQT